MNAATALRPVRLALVALLGCGIAAAVETSPVLLFWPAADGAGVAGAWTARATGPSAGFWNPAGLAFSPKTEVAITAREMKTFDWFGHGSFKFSRELDPRPFRRWAAGGLVTLMTRQAIEVYDERMRSVGSYSPWDGLFAVQAATRLSRHFGVGAVVGYFHRMIEPPWVWERVPAEGTRGGQSGGAFAANLGLLFRPMPGLSLGAALTNAGSSVCFTAGSAPEPLPTALRLGGRLVLLSTDRRDLDLLGDASLVLPDRTPDVWSEVWKAAGVELGLFDLFLFRLGFLHAPAWDRTGISYGIGISYQDLVALEIADDRYLSDLASRWWTFSLTLRNLPALFGLLDRDGGGAD